MLHDLSYWSLNWLSEGLYPQAFTSRATPQAIHLTFMPAREKITSTASSSQKKSQQYSTDKACAIKKRRHQQSNDQNFLIHSPVPLPNARPRLIEEHGITINEIPPPAETGNGKEIVFCFSTFEVGSTSATPTKHNNLEATIALTDMSPQTETGSTSRVVPNKAHNIVGCLLTFEIGLTSATITKQHSSEATITGSTGALLPRRQCRAPRVKRNKNKGNMLIGYDTLFSEERSTRECWLSNQIFDSVQIRQTQVV
ncbi:hypothetical protein P3S68_033120 [Capsicum galapagoense]